MRSHAGGIDKGVRSGTIRPMPHPRNREYRPITPEWLADEIELAGDLDGARRVWRRFSNRISQTGEGTDLAPWWDEAVAVLHDRGRVDLARLARDAARLEQTAPRKRAPKKFKLITTEQIAGAVIEAGTVDAIRRVWLRYRRNLGEAHQGDLVERWPDVLSVLDRLGRPDLVVLAREAQRLELEARAAPRRRATKGRRVVPRGELHARTTIPDALVAELRERAAAGASFTSLAREIGVHTATVSRICRGLRRSSLDAGVAITATRE